MKKQVRGIGIEFISVLGLPPVDFVDLAADLGCQHIGIALEPMPFYPKRYPQWSLRNDASLRAEVIAAMRDRGVTISLGEGFLVRPGTDIGDAAVDMDVMCELRVPRVNLLSLESDLTRGFDQCATFAELADARGLQATLEFLPGLPIGDLPTALAAVRHVGKSNFRVLIDTMHFFRSGSKVADIAAIGPNQIGYVQLCDVPLVSKHANYADEARFERMCPGNGELPLFELLCALPPDLIMGLEVPMLGQAEAGVSPNHRLSTCVEATRELLCRLDT